MSQEENSCTQPDTNISSENTTANDFQNFTPVYGNYENENGEVTYEGNLEADVRNHREEVEKEVKDLEDDIDNLKGAISTSGIKPFGGYIPRGATTVVNDWIEAQGKKHIGDIRDKNQWYPPEPLQNDSSAGDLNPDLPQGPNFNPEVDGNSEINTDEINQCDSNPNYSRDDGNVQNTISDGDLNTSSNESIDENNASSSDSKVDDGTNHSLSDDQCSPDNDLYPDTDLKIGESCSPDFDASDLECNPDDFNYSDECTGSEFIPYPDVGINGTDEHSDNQSETSEDNQNETDYQALFEE